MSQRYRVTDFEIWATMFCKVGPNICGSLDWNFIHITLVVCRV